MKRWLVGVCGWVLSGAVLAAGPAAVRKRVEGSMVITGSVLVAPDGTVRSYLIDRPERVPPVVLGLAAKTIPQWRFEPVQVKGVAVAAKARMSLRVVAHRVDDQRFSLAIRGAYFGDEARDESDQPDERRKPDVRRKPPAYPRNAIRAHVSGTVYLLLRVDRNGRVDDAIAEQVNLDVVGSDAEMEHWRHVLAQSSLSAARRWTIPPSAEDLAGGDHWSVRVPVQYNLRRIGAPTPDNYGRWKPYVPGPRAQAPWANDSMRSAAVDALPEDGIFAATQRLHLTTALDNG